MSPGDARSTVWGREGAKEKRGMEPQEQGVGRFVLVYWESGEETSEVSECSDREMDVLMCVCLCVAGDRVKLASWCAKNERGNPQSQRCGGGIDWTGDWAGMSQE